MISSKAGQANGNAAAVMDKVVKPVEEGSGAQAQPSLAPAHSRWVESGDAPPLLLLEGDWTVHGLGDVARPDLARIDHLSIGHGDWRMDSAGALILSRWIDEWRTAGIDVELTALDDDARRLIELVQTRRVDRIPSKPRPLGGLARIGKFTVDQLQEAGHFLGFVGELIWRGLPQMLLFWQIRWKEVLAEIEAAGVRALGIVGLLSFLIGMVMAYQGGATLSNYGANILIVNLVAIITLREMGPLLAAILVAGRTGSSYTAQIGTMRITEEIDALNSLGLSTFSVLVLPKVIALIIVMPLLSLFADVMGLVGGGVVASVGYGVSWPIYLDRIPQVVTVTTMVLGLIKAPVFAVIIALIGCMQGMRVRGSAAEVGRSTTVSVVQSIFMVIVIDAAFSILYNLLGL